MGLEFTFFKKCLKKFTSYLEIKQGSAGLLNVKSSVESGSLTLQITHNNTTIEIPLGKQFVDLKDFENDEITLTILGNNAVNGKVLCKLLPV